MITTPFETRVLSVIQSCHGLIPTEQLEEMSSLVRAGEPGVALENLSTQLYEYEAPVQQATIDEIEELGNAMELNPKYWARLKHGRLER